MFDIHVQLEEPSQILEGSVKEIESIDEKVTFQQQKHLCSDFSNREKN